MELQQLRYLLAVSKTLNFSKAAEELFISQPTLSHQIKRLEEELGVTLMTRSTRNVEMTAIGLAVVEQAQQAADAADAIMDLCQEENRRNTKRLNIGVLAVYPQLSISSILAEFQSLHLTQAVNLYFDWSSELIKRLRRKKADVIVANLNEEMLTEEDRESLDIHIFLRDRLYAVVNADHPLAEKRSASIEEIIKEKLFLPGSASSANLFFAQAVQNAGFKMPVYNESPSVTNAFNCVATGLGISVMSRHISNAYMRENMRLVPIEPQIGTLTAIITRKESLKRPIVMEFRDFFLSQETIRNM